MLRIIYNLTDHDLAKRRFREDISILNFYFDTPFISKMTLEMRVTIFDQIAAIGGALGLFTGISLISLVEVVYWLARYFTSFAKFRLRGGEKRKSAGNSRAAAAHGVEAGGVANIVVTSPTRREPSARAFFRPRRQLAQDGDKNGNNNNAAITSLKNPNEYAPYDSTLAQNMYAGDVRF